MNNLNTKYFICIAFEYFVPSGFKLLRFMCNEVFVVKDMFISNKECFGFKDVGGILIMLG